MYKVMSKPGSHLAGFRLRGSDQQAHVKLTVQANAVAAALADLLKQFCREATSGGNSSKRGVLAPTRLREALSASKPSSFLVGQSLTSVESQSS